MARFAQSHAEKGSQKWLQKLVNEKPRFLNSEIVKELKLPKEEEIIWLSPLKEDDYAEYRDQAFLDRLGLKLQCLSLNDFWPKGGPQWDALGKSSLGKLFMVEAKSHIRELISTLQAKEEDSARRIYVSLEETKRFLNSKAETDWSHGFYQYVNRLAHLYLLRQNQLPAYLIFVYFINDFEMQGPTTIHEWKGAIELLHSYLGIRRHKLQKFVADVFIDISRLE